MEEARGLVVRLSLVCACLAACVTCQSTSESTSTLALGSTIILQNTTLVSQGGRFQVGLIAGASGFYTLAIWYAQPPTPALKTVVWVADRASTVNLSFFNGTSLTLSALGDLQLYGFNNATVSNSPGVVWSSNTANLNVTSATIRDTGNLVLLNRQNQVVWQSFDTPTDTLLPNQTFSSAAGAAAALTAWRDGGDWGPGNYSLTWSSNGSALTAFWQNPYRWFAGPTVTYWSPLPSGRSFSHVVLSPGGDFRAVAKSPGTNATSIVTKSVDPSRLVRVTLDTDGNVRMYSWAVGSANWTVEWTAVDECSLPGHCGPRGICEDGLCRCPAGTQLLDAADPRLGCVLTTPLRCANATGNFSDKFGPVENVDWGFVSDWGHNSDLNYFADISVSSCKQRCLADCACKAAVMTLSSDGNASTVTCWLKQSPLLNGTHSQNRQCFIRISGSDTSIAVDPPTPEPSAALQRAHHPSAAVVGVAYGVGTAAAILALFSCCFGAFWYSQRLKSQEHKWLHDKWVAARGVMVRFTYRELRLMTDNFDVEIGRGGFGSVYKGRIGDTKFGGVTVAVKRLNKELSNHVEKEFLNEVNSIGRIHHQHLVSLLGYCSDGDHRLLVYEYVEKGSLDAALFRKGGEQEGAGISPVLEWRPRFAIAIHTARGLAYLHEDCDQQIIHCDVKPENILLDASLSAKVADFGISRIMQRDQTSTVTMHVRGTRGYLAPEYWASDCVSITNKVDVFSYGMVLLEIISGRRNLMSFDSSSVDSGGVNMDMLFFPKWAFPKIETVEFMDVVDPALTGIVNPEEVQRALQVAFWCINGKPHMRPSMSEVVKMLRGEVDINFPVPRPEYLDSDVTGNINASSSDDRLSSWSTSGSLNRGNSLQP